MKQAKMFSMREEILKPIYILLNDKREVKPYIQLFVSDKIFYNSPFSVWKQELISSRMEIFEKVNKI